jgi:uncharacterized membrane protein YgcG
MNTNIKPAVRFKNMITKKFSVRFHMFIILTAVITFGLVLSRVCLWLGLSNMIIRYALVITVSYAFFFLAIRLWLNYVLPSMKHRENISGSSSIDGDLISSINIPSPSGSAEEIPSGGGGMYTGAGAGGNWGSGITANAGNTETQVQGIISASSSASDSSDGLFSIGDIDADSAGALVILLVVVIIAAVLGGAVYLIYQAPAILSEAAFNALLSGSMIRASKKMRTEDWTGSVFKATWIPFTIIAVITIAAAVILVKVFPGETNLGDIVRHSLLK